MTKSGSVYKVIELVGSSPVSWADAAQKAVTRASASLRNLRIVTINEQDAKIEDGKIILFRVKLSVSFKFED